MGRAVFPFPGGKSQYANFIVEVLPEHTLYCEVFGGAAGVLFNKPRSKVEVYNDLDGDLVQFFDTLRDRPEELVEYLRLVPFSRELFERWRHDFYHTDERPDDPVERAARFFFLRYTQFSGRYNRAVSMTSSTASGSGTNVAAKMSRKRESLMEFAERLDGVQIENQDYSSVVERYDNPDTVFYLDPPYFGRESEYYREGADFDHAELASLLEGIEGKWAISYRDVPEQFDGLDLWERTRERRYSLGSGGKGDGDKKNVERVLMNYDPDSTPLQFGGEQP